jgi:hypothetical protein
MNKAKVSCVMGLGMVAAMGVARTASADIQTSFRQAYKGESAGNSNFGAGYTFEYGYSASKVGSVANTAADARVGSWARLFGKTFDAVSLRANGTARLATVAPNCTASIAYETYLVGIKVPAGTGSIQGGQFVKKNVFTPRVQQLTPKAEVTLVAVGPARLVFQAWAGATEYITVNGNVWCNNVSAEMRPGVALTAVGDFKFDVVIAAAGLKGKLNLMDMALPAKANVNWGYKIFSDFFSGGSFCNWDMNASASANFEITPVSGSFEPWVRVGLPCVDIWGILPGKGICLNKEWSHKLWTFTSGKYVYPLVGSSGAPFLGASTPSCPSVPASPVRN